MLKRTVGSLDFDTVRILCDDRFATHLDLRADFEAERVEEYVQTALGITNPHGNFSAWEHSLGEKILAGLDNRPQRVFDLAAKLFHAVTPDEVVEVIYAADITNLKISVGSEIAMMLKPDQFWVTNRRTLYAHLLVRADGDTSNANEIMGIYASDSDQWKDFHIPIGQSLQVLAETANVVASDKEHPPGVLPYLWGDAIADHLYSQHYLER